MSIFGLDDDGAVAPAPAFAVSGLLAARLTEVTPV
jgi:hypothetical protein